MSEFVMPRSPSLTGPAGPLRQALHRVVPALAAMLNDAGEAGSRAATTITDLFESSIFEVEDLDAVNALVNRLQLPRHRWDLAVLASMGEAHESLTVALRMTHPQQLPYPTVGLAARVIDAYRNDRHLLRKDLVEHNSPVEGLVRVVNDAPFPERTIQPIPGLWSAMVGIDEWPAGVVANRTGPVGAGLTQQMEGLGAGQLGRILRSTRPWNIVVRADDPDAGAHRMAELCQYLGVAHVRLRITEASADHVVNLAVHALARDQLPIIVVEGDNDGVIDLAFRPTMLGPMVVSAGPQKRVVPGSHPFWEERFERLDASSRRDMWTSLVGNAGAEIANLVGPWVGPQLALNAVTDARAAAALDDRFPETAEIIDGLRARSIPNLPSGVRIVKPTAKRRNLIVDDAAGRAIDQAVARIGDQTQVYEEWGLSPDRRGGTGVRILLAGPPGTGKTLAAEVMAKELAVDLLVVDLAQIVSKWLGETEKNLATVFDVAERCQAVLVFDEADALFARRTEVTDSKDRYANLETAYLLTRLERFEGLTVLTTNQRQQIDPAFIRRLDVVVDLSEPNAKQREQLWAVHLPSTAPVAADVDLVELAERYPLAGGVIRNAAMAAAFNAADNQSTIDRRRLIDAIEQECLKAGRPFAGRPTDLPTKPTTRTAL